MQINKLYLIITGVALLAVFVFIIFKFKGVGDRIQKLENILVQNIEAVPEKIHIRPRLQPQPQSRPQPVNDNSSYPVDPATYTQNPRPVESDNTAMPDNTMPERSEMEIAVEEEDIEDLNPSDSEESVEDLDLEIMEEIQNIK